MLIIGLSTEALIFFFSVWEPPAEHVDWSLVYPELAHMDDHDEEHEGGMITSEESDAGYIPKGTVTEQLDRMLEDAKIGPELIQSLSQGMKSLSNNASNLSDLSDAAAATTAPAVLQVQRSQTLER